MKKFHEVDVTTMGGISLRYIYHVLSVGGWQKSIEGLEMRLDDNNGIVVQGWATELVWNKFETMVLYHLPYYWQ